MNRTRTLLVTVVMMALLIGCDSAKGPKEATESRPTVSPEREKEAQPKTDESTQPAAPAVTNSSSDQVSAQPTSNLPTSLRST